MKEGALPMPSDLQSRWQYLELARFCQGVISSLYIYLDKGELPNAVLEQSLEAIRSVQVGDPYRFSGGTAEALGSYEQVRTLEEVWKIKHLNEAVELTSALLREGTIEDKSAKAKRVIELFSKLQAKALWNFEQAKQTPPPDVGELCKALKTV
jgi:hypothetical protein